MNLNYQFEMIDNSLYIIYRGAYHSKYSIKMILVAFEIKV